MTKRPMTADDLWDLPRVGVPARKTQGNRDAAGVGELDRVRDEVGGNLPEPGRVGEQSFWELSVDL